MKNLHNILFPVLDDIKAERKNIEVSELWGASKALFLCGLRQETGRPLIIVTASEDTAASLLEGRHRQDRNPALPDLGPAPL
jgi:hypothetical protein